MAFQDSLLGRHELLGPDAGSSGRTALRSFLGPSLMRCSLDGVAV